MVNLLSLLRQLKSSLVAVAPLVVSTTLAVGQPAWNQPITFRFGAAQFTVERHFVLTRPSPRAPGTLSRAEWDATTEYEMSTGQRFELNARNIFPQSLTCARSLKTMILTYSPTGQVPDSMPFGGWERRPTDNPAIVRLVAPISGGGNVDYYEFEIDEFHHHGGVRKLTFQHASGSSPDEPGTIRMTMGIVRGIRVHVAFSGECFLRDGVILTRQIREFLLQRVQPNHERERNRVAQMPQSTAPSPASRDCSARFSAFIEELDAVLASDPPSIDPVLAVLHKYFPVEGCDVQQVVEIARRSRFFASAPEMPSYYAVAFDSKGLSDRPGLAVQVSFLKANGNSWLPFAKVNSF